MSFTYGVFLVVIRNNQHGLSFADVYRKLIVGHKCTVMLVYVVAFTDLKGLVFAVII